MQGRLFIFRRVFSFIWERLLTKKKDISVLRWLVRRTGRDIFLKIKFKIFYCEEKDSSCFAEFNGQRETNPTYLA